MKRLIYLAALVFSIASSSPASAISTDDYNAFVNGTVFDVENENLSGCTLGNTVSAALPSSVPRAYATIFSAASAAYKINPNYLASIFVTEHGNTWPNPAGPWASSPTGAQGPFQFEPATWQAYKTDGNNDGKDDVQNLNDAAYSAANMLANGQGTKPSTILGDIARPWVPGHFLYVAGAYNAGGGTLQQHTTPTDPLNAPGLASLSDGGAQVKNYVANVYYLVTTGFVHGNPGYGNANGTVTDHSGSTPTTNGPSSPTLSTSDCSSGVSSNDITQVALDLSWSDGPHGLSAKPTYATAVSQYNPGAPFNGADCGAFVGIVMRKSKADPSYPASGTSGQNDYASKSSKYQKVKNIQNTSDLMPGDIFIVNAGSGAGAAGHTFIYTGPQPNKTTIAEASMDDQMPYQNVVFFKDDRGLYNIYRKVN